MSNWNITPAGNLDAGTIYGLTEAQLKAGVLPTVVSSGNFTAAANTRHVITGFTSTVTLPAGQPVGTRIILSPNSAAITVQAPALNYFAYIGVSSTLGGTIVAQAQASTVELCVNVNSGQIQWEIVNFTGSWLISRSPTPYIIDQLGNQTQSIVKAGIQKDQSSPITISALNSKLYDNAGIQSIDFLNRQLFDNSNNLSEDYKNRQLYSSDGHTIMLNYATNGVAYCANPNVWRWGDATNYVELNSFANLGVVYSGTVRPRLKLWIPISQMTRTPAATLVNTVNDTLNFTNGQSAVFSFQVPWDCDQSVALDVRAVYAPSNTNVGTLTWSLDYIINFNNSTLLTNPTTAVAVTDTTSGTQDLITKSSSLAIAANTFSRDTFITCRLLRVATSTFTGTARLLGVAIQYTLLSTGN